MPRDALGDYEYFPTTTTFCDVCGKRKPKGDCLRDERGVVCADCVARDEEARLPDRLVAVHAQWSERLPREAGLAVGDVIEIEGHELTVTRLDELEIDRFSRTELRVWLKPWSADRPPPQRDPETLAQIRASMELKRKRKGKGKGKGASPPAGATGGAPEEPGGEAGEPEPSGKTPIRDRLRRHGDHGLGRR